MLVRLTRLAPSRISWHLVGPSYLSYEVKQPNNPRAVVRGPGAALGSQEALRPKIQLFPQGQRTEEFLVASSLQEDMGPESAGIQWGYKTQAAKDLGKLVLPRFPIAGLGESNRKNAGRKKDTWIGRPRLTHLQIMRGLRDHRVQALLSHHC